MTTSRDASGITVNFSASALSRRGPFHLLLEATGEWEESIPWRFLSSTGDESA
jgi:hypothetical protein